MEIIYRYKFMRFRLLRQIKTIIQSLTLMLESGANLLQKRYNELAKKITFCKLPDPLVFESGEVVTGPQEWFEKRRPELISLFQNYMYGKSPFRNLKASFSTTYLDKQALKGIATYKEIKIGIQHQPRSFFIVSIYVPNIIKKYQNKSPIFIGLNFLGNHSVHKDPKINITESWLPYDSYVKGMRREVFRGLDSLSWPITYLIKNGYALATAYYGDVVPDRADGLEMALSKWFPDLSQDQVINRSWGAIDAWAWQLSKIMDYIQNDEDLDSEKVVLMGHSRLGKAALWAGAQDSRFTIVISNESGCCGAGLSRWRQGETISKLNMSNPHWLSEKFKKFNNHEELLPFDQHELISLIAPRPVYIASARHDLEADPVGEFMAAKLASKVYEFLGYDCLPLKGLPAVNIPAMGYIGYHMRKGGHGITKFDWCQFIKFAEIHFKNKKETKYKQRN